jgi:hypothetical protein
VKFLAWALSTFFIIHLAQADCESESQAILLNQGKSRVLGVGIFNQSAPGNEMMNCLAQNRPNRISCLEKKGDCSRGESSVISPQCRLKLYPGQTELQATKDSEDPLNLIAPGKSVFIQETSFPCVDGQERCPDMPKTCSQLRMAFSSKGGDWIDANTRKTDKFKTWDSETCAGTKRGLHKTTVQEMKCKGEEILAYPKVSYQGDCTTKPMEGDYTFSVQLTWLKTCTSTGRGNESPSGSVSGTIQAK